MRSLLFVLFLVLNSLAAIAEEIVIDNEGLKLNANLVKVDGNWPEGPVILMTHGTLAHGGMEIMSGLQTMFKERGISSLSINLSLGIDNRHGMYDCSVPHRHLHTDAVNEIGMWHDWLRSQGVERIALLGHSRGGNQTARYAAKIQDEAVTNVFLIAPATWSDEYQHKDYQKRYTKALAPLLLQARQMVENGQGSNMIKNIDFIYCADTQATAQAFVSYYQNDPEMDTPTLVPSIDYPLIIFAGSEDKVVDDLVEKTENLVDGQKSQLVIIEGADHFFRDLYSEDIADAISDALEAP